jgi:hypothetical protein
MALMYDRKLLDATCPTCAPVRRCDLATLMPTADIRRRQNPACHPAPRQAATDLKALLGDIVEGVARPRTTGEPLSPLLDGAALEHGAPEVVLVMLGSEVRAVAAACD